MLSDGEMFTETTICLFSKEAYGIYCSWKDYRKKMKWSVGLFRFGRNREWKLTGKEKRHYYESKGRFCVLL